MANRLTVPHQWIENELSGFQWNREFTKKYKREISLRKPQATNLGRVTSFNTQNVNLLFFNLDTKIQKYGLFSPQDIYNPNECGLTTVQDAPLVYAKTGEKQVGKITSAEQGQLVTMIDAINMIGNHIPPHLVFLRVHFKHYMIKGIGNANLSGWSNDDVFYFYVECFIKFTKVSKEKKFCLLQIIMTHIFRIQLSNFLKNLA